ncbi:MAG: hypothetical protein A2W99_15860 [Bacteroidetes bacterium GWF2_33_16]|nr:MAG: hypothetical protein A2X00_15205 [Bacteroidetes bacterium GWE2_32_14]OFY02379.1 MAG: hypothetical protein A2W99_15860 [Bacteroidetes bacterium GWF2_33_16]
MEKSDVQQTSSLEKNELILDAKSIVYITETRKWAKFLAILGFVFLGLIILLGLFFLLIGSIFGGFLGVFERVLIFLVYIAIGALYFFPVYYLFKFSFFIKKAVEKYEQKDLTIAFENLKSHYKFIGILTIVVLSLYVLIGIVAAIIGMAKIF